MLHKLELSGKKVEDTIKCDSEYHTKNDDCDVVHKLQIRNKINARHL